MSTQDRTSAATLSWDNEAEAAEQLPAHVEVRASNSLMTSKPLTHCRRAGRCVEGDANPFQFVEQRHEVEQRRARDCARGGD